LWRAPAFDATRYFPATGIDARRSDDALGPADGDEQGRVSFSAWDLHPLCWGFEAGARDRKPGVAPVNRSRSRDTQSRRSNRADVNLIS